MPRGLILQPTYRIRDHLPVVQLFGKLDDGRAFLIEDDRFRPYVFVKEKDAPRVARETRVRIEPTDLRSLEGERLVRVILEVPADAPALRDRMKRDGIPLLEGDLRFPHRYLIDRGLRAGVEIRGEETPSAKSLVLFRNPVLLSAESKPKLAVLSIDLETSPDASRLYSVALVGDGVEEAHLVARGAVRDAVVHADERALVQATLERIRALDPDILIGWNVVDFDLRVLARRCTALRVPCEAGRVPGEIRFEQDQSFTRQGRAEIPGRVVLDGIALVRDALRLEDYRLDTVARAVLGRGKLIDSEAPDAAAEIDRLYREDPAALVAYNLEDARLVREILAREGLLSLTLERSLLSGMPLDRVGASVASFDRLYLPELRERGVVARSVEDRRGGPVAGGALLDAVPGVFRDVAVFDFKSLYPSLIRTFQLDPFAHARAAEDAIEAPNGARFARHGAILPELIERFLARRDAAKLRGDRHADQAIKIMMNAFFGVLAAPGCRFFDPEIANAITLFGQQTLRWTSEAFAEEGVRVLYGDTDSVFVELPQDQVTGPARQTLARAERLRATVEARVADRIRRGYRVEPRLTLELEHVLDRFFLPRVRGGGGGSKKRYAGWRDGELLVVGLESVRRDWPAVARRIQEGMLERLFTEGEVVPFVREIVAAVRAGALDHELVYVKRVRKGDLSRYTSTTPPHVQAARKAGRLSGGVIRYVMTARGPEPAYPGRPLPDGIDREYAVERVLRPIADAILDELGTSFDEALGLPRQLSLL